MCILRRGVRANLFWPGTLHNARLHRERVIIRPIEISLVCFFGQYKARVERRHRIDRRHHHQTMMMMIMMMIMYQVMR